MTGVENLFIYRPGRHNLGPGWQFQEIYRPWVLQRRISTGHLDKVLGVSQKTSNLSWPIASSFIDINIKVTHC